METMISQVEQKYINAAIAQFYDKALKYSARYLNKAYKSPREKALWAALAQDACRSYNLIVGLIGHLGSSEIAKEKRVVWNKEMRATLEIISDEEIEDIVEQAYKNSTDSRRAARDAERNRVISYINNHPEFVAGMLTNIDTVARKSTKALDSKKGGLVRHYMHDLGMNIVEARAKAQETIDNELIAQRVKDFPANIIEEIELLRDNRIENPSIENAVEDVNSILDLLGPSNSVEGDSYVSDNVNPNSSDNDNFSVFDTEDPTDMATPSDQAPTFQNPPTTKLNEAEQIREALVKAGVKIR